MFIEKARKESRLGKMCTIEGFVVLVLFYKAQFCVMNDWGVMLLSWNNGRLRKQIKDLILQSSIDLTIKTCCAMYGLKCLSIANFKNSIEFYFIFLLNRLMHNKQCVKCMYMPKICYLMCIMKRNEWALRRQWVT